MRSVCWFRCSARVWFKRQAEPKPGAARPKLNESNPERRLICRACTPDRVLLSGNWYAVYCPRCGGEAAEEMTEGERNRIQLELDAARALGLRRWP